jgi:type III secretion protein L
VQGILDAAQEEAQRRRSAAHSRGRVQGMGEGMLQAARILLEGKIQARQADVQNAEEAQDLALFIARKIVGPDIKLETESVAQIIHDAVANVRRKRWIQLRLDPADSAALRGQLPALAAALVETGDVELFDDPSLPPEQAVLEADGVQISLEVSKLVELLQELYGT